MQILSLKHKWQFSIIIIAVLLGLSSTYYTNYLTSRLSEEERKKIELWAEAEKEIEEVEYDGQISLILIKILQENKTIPVIHADENGNILAHINLDPEKNKDTVYLKNQIEIMKSQHEPIVLNFSEKYKQYIYYKDSALLTQLIYYPIFQIGVIMFFIIISYFAFDSSKKAQQNRVWVGMSKETAHQLGTPISSLLAWVELLKLQDNEDNMVKEVEKDVKRLEAVTERFSKIGSTPVLHKTNISLILLSSVAYLKTRTSSKVKYIQNFDPKAEILVPLSASLFEWVIENLWKNAVDAMSGNGQISINLTEYNKYIYIDIRDSGKGVAKSKFKTVFKPGYTTKKRGWGLGLSLVKRIIEFYHSGKIYVKSSELNKGTTFRIVLKK